DGAIQAIGHFRDLKLNLQNSKNTINLQGKLLLPTFCDVHTHFFEMAKMSQYIDLSKATSVEEIRALLIEWRKELKNKPKWIRGWGWSINKYKDAALLNKTLLDTVFPDIPVTFDSFDLHTKWCNSLALKIAGINKDTKNPLGGEIAKDTNGEPNGILKELAWELINRVIPEYSFSEKKDLVKKSIQHAWAYGISGVHFMEGQDSFEINKSLVEEDTKFRFYWHFPSTAIDEMIELKKKNNFKLFPSKTTDEAYGRFLRIMGMKVFMDGSLGSKTAWMFDPYPGDNKLLNYGRLSQNFEELYQLMLKAAKEGIPSTIHSIGDRCSHELIKCFIKLNHEVSEPLNHRIEHLQALKQEDFALLKKSGVSCALQPVHMKEDIAYIQDVWKEAWAWAYPVKTLLDYQIPFAFSSDAPVETINPFQGIYSAIERKMYNDPKSPTWRQEERISVMQAIDAYTKCAAKISGVIDQLGTIKEGYTADLMVIDNFLEQDNTFWLTAKSHLTIVDGKIVYQDI
ncbi:MAG TPA: amidohydrolase family protein, partial [Candidatus Cloacimonadota bacterium]|nr:amidohydrolase family protein [Candidatus Cloacimonadota bacterium]